MQPPGERETMRTNAFIGGLVFCAALLAGDAARAADRTLDIYFLDVVGGGSTLIVTPLGESVLIDTGSLRPLHRDADRILKACEDAGLQQIDFLVTTHFHSDHYGAILEVSRRIPVKHFMHKGPLPPEHEQKSKSFQELYPLYQQATGGKATTIRAGDDIPLKNDPAGKAPEITLHCVASDKKVEGFDGDIDAPVPGCEMKEPDESDNARSTALILTYGHFKAFLGADITWNVEHHLAQPLNAWAVRHHYARSIYPIGKVDLYQVTHHGLDQSNNPLLLKALDPTVAVAMNGPRKGIQPRTFKDLTALPNLKALYQIHYNTQYGDAGNTKPEFIANPKDDSDQGQFIKASVPPETRTFTLQTGPDGTQRSYPVTPTPPDLSECTRLEIRFRPSTLDELGLAQRLLNEEEAEYVLSLDPIVCEDDEGIRTFARELSLAGYEGSGMPGVRVKAHVIVTCYAHDTKVASFQARGPYVAFEGGYAFENERIYTHLRELSRPLHPFQIRYKCADNLVRFRSMLKNAAKAGGSYPAPATWADIFYWTPQGKTLHWFRCPSAGVGNCHYAMNPSCKPDSPEDTVLLFETTAGWNQHGGPELFTFDNHDPRGGCVLLNDGTVKFIRTPAELQALRWK